MNQKLTHRHRELIVVVGGGGGQEGQGWEWGISRRERSHTGC